LALWTALVAIIGQKSVIKVFKRWLEAKERQEWRYYAKLVQSTLVWAKEGQSKLFCASLS